MSALLQDQNYIGSIESILKGSPLECRLLEVTSSDGLPHTLSCQPLVVLSPFFRSKLLPGFLLQRATANHSRGHSKCS